MKPAPWVPVPDSSEASAADPEALLPASFQANRFEYKVASEHIAEALDRELSVERLNSIHKHLWLAGRPQPARPLHKQAAIGRKIVLTENIGCHLLWTEDRIYLKPLPRFLLNHKFWCTHIVHNPEIYALGLGFLTSYVWLVCHESDFELAKQLRLFPSNLTFDGWREIVRTLLSARDYSASLNCRYQYGELRLGRINTIFRFMPGVEGSLMRGYYSTYTQYGAYFRRNFAWIFAVFLFFNLILSAMQVGLATDVLNRSILYQRTSSAFAVIVTLAVICIVACGFGLFLYLFLYHLFITIEFKRRNMGSKDASI